MESGQQNMRGKEVNMKNKIVTSLLAIFCLSATTQMMPKPEVQEGYELVINYDNMQEIDFND